MACIFHAIPYFFNVIDKVALLCNCKASSLKFSVELQHGRETSEAGSNVAELEGLSNQNLTDSSHSLVMRARKKRWRQISLQIYEVYLTLTKKPEKSLINMRNRK